MRSPGRSATSGSRLFISIRRAASCGQPLQLIARPRGARTTRVSGSAMPVMEAAGSGAVLGCELAACDRVGEPRDVTGKDAVVTQRCDELSHRGERGLDATAGLERPPGLD